MLLSDLCVKLFGSRFFFSFLFCFKYVLTVCAFSSEIKVFQITKSFQIENEGRRRVKKVSMFRSILHQHLKGEEGQTSKQHSEQNAWMKHETVISRPTEWS